MYVQGSQPDGPQTEWVAQLGSIAETGLHSGAWVWECCCLGLRAPAWQGALVCVSGHRCLRPLWVDIGELWERG